MAIYISGMQKASALRDCTKLQGQVQPEIDDANPAKEDIEYVESIKEDVQWLGFQWDNIYYSITFNNCMNWLSSIKAGSVCLYLSPEETREYRGGWDSVGKDNYRDREIQENLSLFERMKSGEFVDGEHTLRAKIDMASPNMNMRDPAMYRIKHIHHHRTGSEWCIYPMYDLLTESPTPLKISLTQSALEFEHHRPLYDWFLDELDIFRSRQYEFARLNITHTIMSKRRLLQHENKHVEGWDDAATISGLRRRGYTPEAIRVLHTR